MALLLGSNISLVSKHFLDERQELALTESDLKSWDLVKNPLPNGFEIYLDANKSWYILDNENEDDLKTGKFRKRTEALDLDIEEINNRLDGVDTRLEGIDTEIDQIQKDLKGIDENAAEIEKIKKDILNRHLSGVADKFSDLLLESNWVKEGTNYSYEGILVSVIKDETANKNGTYRLEGTDYTLPEKWIKQVDHNSAIGVEINPDLEVSDSTFYTSKKVDTKFIDRENDQTITKEWKFDNNISFGSNRSGLTIDKEKEDYTTLTVDKLVADDINITVGVVNFIKNSSFTGNYRSQELGGDSALNDRSYVYSTPYKFWQGEGTWEIVDDYKTDSGKAVKIEKDLSRIYQEIEYQMIPGEAYILTFKTKGDIIATIDGNILNTKNIKKGIDYERQEIKFKFTGKLPCIVSFQGDGYITEPKLEWGATRTYWDNSPKDTNPVAKDFTDYDYLRTTFKPLKNELNGVSLRSLIQVGKIRGEEVDEIYGGLSGVLNSEEDVLFWVGGSYTDAVNLVNEIRFNPGFDITKSKVNLVITASGEVYSKSLMELENRIKKLVETLNKDK